MACPTAISQAAAPWRVLFLRQLSEMSSPTFVLATLHSHPNSPAPPSTPSFPPTPRARTCVFRGMWATLPPNQRNQARRNPRLFESDMPVFTTDARMDKLAELGRRPDDDGGGGGGGWCGGGPVEAVWWVPEARTQWRVRGTAWVLGQGGPAGPDDAASSRPTWEAVGARMRRVQGGGGDEEEEDWSWAREVTAHFGNLSPAMRGTFRNPPPGAPRCEFEPAPGEGPGRRVEDLEDGLARRNFRVCIIVPEEVDRVLLTEEPRRWLYRFVGGAAGDRHADGEGGAGEWETTELWP